MKEMITVKNFCKFLFFTLFYFNILIFYSKKENDPTLDSVFVYNG